MLIDLIKYPVRTSKYTVQTSEKNQNKYAFDLDVRLNKKQIRTLIEKIFQVNVTSVNTYLAPVKKKRLGFNQGYKTRYKRAIITLKANQKIDVSIS